MSDQNISDVMPDLRQAAADRQSGAMPSWVQRRDDALEVWAAFRRHVGYAWTGELERTFIAGWDAASRRSDITALPPEANP